MVSMLATLLTKAVIVVIMLIILLALLGRRILQSGVFLFVFSSFTSGFIFAWLRERSGSWLMPVIAHGLEDFFFFLPRML
jgi:membrane protease YdiL (CAAX protease family)